MTVSANLRDSAQNFHNNSTEQYDKNPGSRNSLAKPLQSFKDLGQLLWHERYVPPTHGSEDGRWEGGDVTVTFDSWRADSHGSCCPRCAHSGQGQALAKVALGGTGKLFLRVLTCSCVFKQEWMMNNEGRTGTRLFAFSRTALF